MKKKSIVCILSLVLVLALTACGETSTQKAITSAGGNTDAAGAVQNTAAGNVTGNAAADETANTASEDASAGGITIPTIEKSVLVEKKDVTITAEELVNDSIYGPGLKILIENNSKKNIVVQTLYTVVNDYMIDTLLSTDVAAGKKANDVLYFSTTSLEAAGITQLADISVNFDVSDGDSYESIFHSGEIKVATSASGTVKQPAADDGKELYNKDGIRIVGKYVEEDTFWGAGVLLYIQNDSKQSIIVQCDNMSINGFMVDPLFSAQVNKGRKAVSEITVLSDDLEKNGITSVDEIELSFHIINPKTFQTIKDTKQVKFSTK